MKSFNEILIEDNTDNKIAKELQKKFGIKIKKVDVIKKVTFTLEKEIDKNDFDNFDLIDGIHALLKDKYKGAITKHDRNKFTIEEL